MIRRVRGLAALCFGWFCSPRHDPIPTPWPCSRSPPLNPRCSLHRSITASPLSCAVARLSLSASTLFCSHRPFPGK
jgi:hypothetical protein